MGHFLTSLPAYSEAGLYSSAQALSTSLTSSPLLIPFISSQRNDNWFYNEAVGVHSFAELQDMYETSTGHNTAVIIDFAPRPDGSLPPEQVAVAAALGGYVEKCYGAPIVQGAGNQSVITLMPSAAVAVDRLLVAEDQRLGQLVRAFVITAMLANGSTAELARGSSIGNKFIAVLAAPATVTELTLNITAIAGLAPPGAPFVANFAAFACDAAAEEARAGLVQQGFAQPPPSTVAQRAAARARSGKAAEAAAGAGAAGRTAVRRWR